MPNQLSATKKRKTIAEHAMVWSVLDELARQRDTTSTELVRKAVHEYLKRNIESLSKEDRETFRRAAYQHAPKLPKNLKTHQQVQVFKGQQRHMDTLLMETGITTPQEMQRINSITSVKPRLVSGF